MPSSVVLPSRRDSFLGLRRHPIVPVYIPWPYAVPLSLLRRGRHYNTHIITFLGDLRADNIIAIFPRPSSFSLVERGTAGCGLHSHICTPILPRRREANSYTWRPQLLKSTIHQNQKHQTSCKSTCGEARRTHHQQDVGHPAGRVQVTSNWVTSHESQTNLRDIGPPAY